MPHSAEIPDYVIERIMAKRGRLHVFDKFDPAKTALVVIDNVFATPVLQRPREMGADIVAYSATKMMDGQGRVLAGAVAGSASCIRAWRSASVASTTSRMVASEASTS